MNVQRGKLVSGGRLQVPADIRRALGLSDGDSVTMQVIDGELHIKPYRDVIAGVRERLRPFISEGASLADELIAERRAASEIE
ncbi:MAG: AbrB/MazE/SpoVT family DNA-binding domain-containing protein [Candidatus Andeanibacterium colombiense]|uniref:AbrB/MazE/SpoVT family DNA-binding domain-containing protein n=1 Tax=Candidatus Andeanibacterium colombiense TaxID=3121345 RepID=A0AAJ5X495_9SPHN|nr:MAG: AbrB/MazE/SpoVT family DNA-binding domain-containing protein [Sphingomonadaceae bacterium]